MTEPDMKRLIQVHRRQILDKYFRMVSSGEKTFEVRHKKASDFVVGDLLILENLDTHEELVTRISCIYEGELGGIQPGWVILGISLT